MEVWISNFIWFFLLMTITGWFVPKIFWVSKDNVFSSVLFCFIFSFVTMALMGWVLALLVYSFEVGFLKMLKAFFSDVGGGIFFSLERSFQTGSGWLITIIIRIISLTYKDVISKKS
ncbi:MAG: hypothetical protein O3A15_03165 [Proteobacteria bacterium]|nr:hypothetical protein [Pseudomonadota bacterium]